MQYTPKLPRHNNNVTHEHPLREFGVLLVAASIVFFGVLWVAGLFIDAAVDYIDPELEEQLFSGRFDSSFPTASEAESTTQDIQHLSDGIRDCLGIKRSIEVRVVSSPVANALAIPGGLVVLYTGLLEQLDSKNQVAFVLAHELAHFKNRDHLRGMGRSVVYFAASAMLTGANSGLSSVLAQLVSVGAASHSQERESAADVSGLEALHCHFGHVGGATAFFERLQATDTGASFPEIPYLSSHPDTATRMAVLDRLAEEQGWGRHVEVPWAPLVGREE